jgi:dephospho-CoA kinase
MTSIVLLIVLVVCEIRVSTFGFAPFIPATTTTSTRLAALEDDSQRDYMATFQVLGVCGGIGTGKSTACRVLVSECGCMAHLDADILAHSVYAPGSRAVQDVVAEFGREILVNEDAVASGDRVEIDRKKLGAVVFGDRSQMAKLERIVWPHVKTLIVSEIDRLRREWETSGGSDNTRRPIVILEAAVMLDAGWDDLLDGVWIVTAPREVALRRLMETRGLSQEEAEKRITAQESRRGMGTFQQELDSGVITGVIENKGGLEELTVTMKDALENKAFWKK